MRGHRLEHHYSRLLTRYPQRSVTTTLQALAEDLNCSKRHMRALLIKMQACQWLEWRATPGRGHQAQLNLLRDEQQLLMARADRLLACGDFTAAADLLGDEQQQLTVLLRARLGYSIRDDHQILRVPYYRTMPNLFPGTALRRSETHLVRQLFNGLTRVNEAASAACPDLAHRWRQLDERRWRFFLRPGVLFHDGRPLTSEDVVATLTRCARLPLFSHLSEITAAGTLSVTVELSQPDPHLPLLLSDPAALILPADFQQREDFASHPIGTGPYRVMENNQWHLQMQAFEHYFGLRGLLDEVDVIVLPDVARAVASEQFNLQQNAATWLSSSISDIDYVSGLAAELTGSPADRSEEMFLERGGYFLMCDARSPLWQQPSCRRWLRNLLNPERLLPQLVEAIRPLWVPAGSLLPDWFHAVEEGAARSPFSAARLKKGRAILRLACHYQHPEYRMLAQVMQATLAAEGITLIVQELDYPRWSAGEAEADLWLGTVNFAEPVAWNVGTWLLGMPLLRHGIAGGDADRLNHWHCAWRDGSLGSAQLMQQIVGSGWLQPLFHHWMRLKAPVHAQGVHLNNLGWFDFQHTWMEPLQYE